MVGRKLPLYGGLVLFGIGSIGSALATDIDVLVLFRFVQGLGAAAGMVIPRAVVRDLHTGVEAARLMSLLMLVFSISPILAPLTGSIIISFSAGVAFLGRSGRCCYRHHSGRNSTKGNANRRSAT